MYGNVCKFLENREILIILIGVDNETNLFQFKANLALHNNFLSLSSQVEIFEKRSRSLLRFFTFHLRVISRLVWFSLKFSLNLRFKLIFKPYYVCIYSGVTRAERCFRWKQGGFFPTKSHYKTPLSRTQGIFASASNVTTNATAAVANSLGNLIFYEIRRGI